MRPFGNVVHDKRQAALPSNSLEVAEESILASGVIVWRSRHDCICTSIFGILRKSQDILQTGI